MAKPIITFDLWDTVFIDDSDEADRAAQGLPTKKERRRQLVHEALLRHGPVRREDVDIAYRSIDAAYGLAWHDLAVTWTVPERLGMILEGLGATLPRDELDALVAAHEDMELHLPPHLAPGIADAIADLATRYTLGVVSDTIFSPGRALRGILSNYGLLQHFAAFAFSDEVGCSKPARGMFDAIVAQTGCQHEDIIHIGDRVTKDIDGPHVVGARGVLTTVVKKRNEAGDEPDGVCHDYATLGAVIDALAGA